MSEGTAKKKVSAVDQSLVDHLLGNSQSAMMAAIEIYNKPMFRYREECTVILLINAWELLLKAILAKNGETIYYPVEPNQPQRTLSWKDAYRKAVAHFPISVASLPTERNLDALATYRDKAIHFYNEDNMATVVYALAQTALVNYRDLLLGLFEIDITDLINLRLLPLSARPPIDVVSFIRGSSQFEVAHETGRFIAELSNMTDEIREANMDLGRLLTIFSVKLESVKKIGDADIVVAVGSDYKGDDVKTVIRPQNPNQTHPLLRNEIISEIGVLHGSAFSGYTFQAIDRKYGIKGNALYHWKDDKVVQHKYSKNLIPFIRRLSKSEVELAITEYRDYLRERRGLSQHNFLDV